MVLALFMSGSIPVRVTMTRKYEHKHIVRNVFAFTERNPT